MRQPLVRQLRSEDSICAIWSIEWIHEVDSQRNQRGLELATRTETRLRGEYKLYLSHTISKEVSQWNSKVTA